MQRYFDKCFEEAAIVLRNMQENGSNATRASLLMDGALLNIPLQFCPGCIPFYLYLVQTLGAHFPNLLNLAIVLNTPDFVIPIWTNLIKPFAPLEVRKIIELYGRKKSDWRDALVTKHGIDWTKLSHEMGGDGPDPVDVFIIFVGEWDMRKAVLAGQSDKMRRYLDKCFEEVATVLRNMQENGSNATRASLMLDAASLSISLQFCPGYLGNPLSKLV
ncbi:Retinal-binding protein [Folsomia candida]|uniref:Retinal-binding protein n=1 Tax=Folsomia candida TaxID=158441 RepID=A0A226D3H7_FOLCA|nr:Retinal-binding protein [Folsomia candida]